MDDEETYARHQGGLAQAEFLRWTTTVLKIEVEKLDVVPEDVDIGHPYWHQWRGQISAIRELVRQLEKVWEL